MAGYCFAFPDFGLLTLYHVYHGHASDIAYFLLDRVAGVRNHSTALQDL